MKRGIVEESLVANAIENAAKGVQPLEIFPLSLQQRMHSPANNGFFLEVPPQLLYAVELEQLLNRRPAQHNVPTRHVLPCSAPHHIQEEILPLLRQHCPEGAVIQQTRQLKLVKERVAVEESAHCNHAMEQRRALHRACDRRRLDLVAQTGSGG